MPIPVSNLRSSAFGTHKMCEMQYLISYHLGFTGVANKKADKGTMLHKVMEILAHVTKNNGKYYDEEIDLDINVDDIWLCDTNDIVNKVFNHHSNIMTTHEWTSKDLVEIHKWFEKTISYNNGALDPRNRTIIEAEQRFCLEIQEPWAIYKDKEGQDAFLKLNGTIDLVTEAAPGIYEIIDWKTGKRKDWATNEEKDHKYLKDDIQLRIYHYAASRLYPDVDQIILTIFFINDGGPFTIHFDKSEINKTIELIKNKYEYIRDTDVPKLLRNERPEDSWKCSKFCHAGINSFAGTNILPIIETRDKQVTKKGNVMSMCEQVRYALKHRTIEQVLENMTKEGFNEGGYRQGIKNE